MPPKHAIPAAPEPKRRDHLWVLLVIAACVLAEVWASWVGIGSISGFPVILGTVPTDWVLAVAMEGYWGYALYAWLAASPGPRSRSMAMWSCGVVFVLSLAGQVLYHELTVPPGMSLGRRVVVGFITSLPVIALAVIAILIHLRHADRAAAAEAKRLADEAARKAESARIAADERTLLRLQLDAERAEHQSAVSDLREEFTRQLQAVTDQRDADMIDLRAQADQSVIDLGIAQQKAAEETARANLLDRQLAAARAERKERAASRKSTSAGGGTAASDGDDVSTELLALMALREKPELCGKRKGGALARELGVSAATGGRLHRKLTSDGSLNEDAARSLMDATGD